MNLRDLVPSAEALEPQAISLDVLREKYCKDNETSIEDVNARVASALADVEPERRDQHREAFLWALQQGFLPAGRIQSAAGTPLAATLINCFVHGVVPIYWGAPSIGDFFNISGVITFESLEQVSGNLRV